MPRLFYCPDCGKPISAKALSCPGCGRVVRVVRVTTIQATGKLWKALQLVGKLIPMTTGVFLGAAFVDGYDRNKMLRWAIVALLSGLPVYAIGRIGAWWFHE
jgi:hypothetical protein